MDELSKLTLKQRRWVEAYVGESRFNATDAARRAGYKDAEQSGWINKNKVEIYAHVEAWLDTHALSGKETLNELRGVAVAEWQDFLTIRRDKDGEILDVRMDLRSKVHALELIGKHHQLFTENVQVSGSVTREYVVVKPGEPTS